MKEIRVGDKIKIVQKAQAITATAVSRWVPEMDSSIGEVGTVYRIDPVYGYMVQVGIHYWWYSKEALSLDLKAEVKPIPPQQDWTLNPFSLPSYSVCYKGVRHAGFTYTRIPHSCSAEEIGALTWMPPYDAKTDKEITIPVDLAREAIEQYLKGRQGQAGTPGMALIHFVKPKGAVQYTSYQWIDLFLEAGFKQVLPVFENHVHPGNQIMQLVKIHTAEKK